MEVKPWRLNGVGYLQERTIQKSRLNEEKVVGDEAKEVEDSECQAKRIWFYF